MLNNTDIIHDDLQVRIVEESAFNDWHPGQDSGRIDIAIQNLQSIRDETATIVRNNMRYLQSCLTLDVSNERVIAIGHDDTLAPEYDGGPCNGFVPLVHITSLASMLEEVWGKDGERLNDERDIWINALEIQIALLQEIGTQNDK